MTHLSSGKVAVGIIAKGIGQAHEKRGQIRTINRENRVTAIFELFSNLRQNSLVSSTTAHSDLEKGRGPSDCTYLVGEEKIRLHNLNF